MESPAERRLEERYEDHLRLYTCRSTSSTAGLPSQIMSSYWRGVLSPFGMGESWYIEAGRQMCAGLDCCLIAPRLGRDCLLRDNSAWRSFRQTHLHRWAHSQELFPISKFQEKIKERLRSYYGVFQDHSPIQMLHSSWYIREWYISGIKETDGERSTEWKMMIPQWLINSDSRVLIAFTGQDQHVGIYFM
ncbi:hypothetical protein EAF00_003715 [Botryotinia globosa]|nr:hypothetical protein EAF00_003715 [Botryotinia globosa]